MLSLTQTIKRGGFQMKKLLTVLNLLVELLLFGKLWQANARKQALIEQLQRHDSAIADQEKEG